ncbi:hypothetical protein [Pelagibacterium montanilacus]|uniref:hypothetical protein n=1 Tax=Pelagibacterium montanilacus TaxID=2185280 RepID=UPI000F8C663C|nr:hypothetical protein [Pelagibacterium montanilacus]
MLRRHLIAGAGAAALGGTLSRQGSAAPSLTLTTLTYVCNLRDHCSDQDIAGLAPQKALEVKVDYSRAYDPGSVAVLRGGKVLGYLPRQTGQHIAAQISAGFLVKARVEAARGGHAPNLSIILETHLGDTA